MATHTVWDQGHYPANAVKMVVDTFYNLEIEDDQQFSRILDLFRKIM